MRLKNITSILMALCFSFSVLMPTAVALAAPPSRPQQNRPARPPQRPPQKRPPQGNFRRPPAQKQPPKRDFHSMQERQRRYERMQREQRRRIVNPNRHYQRNRYRYDSHYYYYDGYRYPRRAYDGWYRHHHYSMHSDDWLRMLGPALFFAALSSIGNNSTVVADQYGNVVYID